ncbi:NtaA/DmoA family FMN-dependent monooxygenase [Nakamurella leprariae]|uniref:NtaA/DmoA family FMN-dependent monooxygenase n=1 Tax=Nakamurella leprariae TaxID=2803911 RepID=A0A939C3N0_9ACTN|nr:NtaA/DmoA family FMN-dependent monooxygenase [Nakamurella leprariae]MBM9469599.1 NtaA/DmoA family FMN-dependent monooxygenase [Nakamurella leprariae]
MLVDDPPRRQLVLNLFSPNAESWRRSGVDTDRAWSIDALVQLAQDAERGLFDAIFLADSPGLGEGYTAPDPFTVLSILAGRTTHLGLAPTLLTTYDEPYTVARQIATLDQYTGGRAGWNAATGSQPSVAGNFGSVDHPDHAVRYERGEEFIEIVTALWDSWAPDAWLGGDGALPTFDRSRIRPVRHQGRHFQVDAVFNVPRSPQGRPVLFHAGSSAVGRAQGARHADAIFTAQPDVDVARAFYADFKRRVASNGRNPDHTRVLPGLFVALGGSEAEAQAQFDEFTDHIDLDRAAARLAVQIGLDLTAAELDAPVAESAWAAAGASFTSRAAVIQAEAAAKRLTARQVILRATAAFGHHIVVGTPEQVADDIELWFRTGAADGFNYRAPVRQAIRHRLHRPRPAAPAAAGHLPLRVHEHHPARPLRTADP